MSTALMPAPVTPTQPASSPAPAPPHAGDGWATAAGTPLTLGDAIAHIAQRIGLFVFAAAAVVFLAGTRFRVLAWGLLATAFLYMLTVRRGAQSVNSWIAQLERWAGV